MNRKILKLYEEACRRHQPVNLGSIPMPIVVEKTARSERAHDIFSRLLADGIIFLGWPIDDTVANLVVAQMLFLQNEQKKQDINLYINSPGGIVTAGLAIYDTMQFVRCDVATFCIGQASSIAALLLAAGTKGKRHALPHSRVLLHQPSAVTQGTAADIGIMADEIVELRNKINSLLARHTGQPLERIERDSDREFYMSAEEAKEYGLVDEVLGSLKELSETEPVGAAAPKA